MGWGGEGQSLPSDFFIFGAGMRERSHLLHPSRKSKLTGWEIKFVNSSLSPIQSKAWPGW